MFLAIVYDRASLSMGYTPTWQHELDENWIIQMRLSLMLRNFLFWFQRYRDHRAKTVEVHSHH